jgi:acetyltransferase-like isoleucine patch superfamily enzyme
MSHSASPFHRGCYRARAIGRAAVSALRGAYWRAQGMQIGARTIVPPLAVTWPHQVALGADCVLEADLLFKWDGIWAPGPRIRIGNRVFLGRGCEFNAQVGIEIGDDSSIASGCKFVDHDHGIVGETIDAAPGRSGAIVLGRHVWLGANVIVLRGVTIGDGAVVAAGAVVTRSIPAREIWAGVPARHLRTRTA